MIKNITMFFLSPYADAPVEIREKAKLFLYLITSSLAFITILFIVLNTLMALTMTNYIIFGLCLGLVISLSLLRKGRYHGAVNSFSFFFTAAIIFLGFYGQIGRGSIDYITNFYFFPVIIIYTALFCRPSWIIFTTTLLLICGVTSYLLNYTNPIGTPFMPVAQSALVDYTASVVLTLILCVTIIKLNGKITEAARREEQTRELHAELEIARLIQSNLMPETPAGDPRISIFATYIPMEEIGGDFYDFFFDINGHLVMVIGDVSGKGVPAALFMAVTRTLFRSAWRETGSPAQALKRTHDELSHDNETCMFVTMYCCVLDPMTGHCRIACGGHNPPLLVRNGEVQVLPNPAGPMVGAPFAARFMEGTLDLLSGDTLFLYTDGLTEAMDIAGELFGMERTCEGLLRCLAPNAQQTAHRMREAVRAHAAGAEQSDDITMLVFRYNGPVAGPIREAL